MVQNNLLTEAQQRRAVIAEALTWKGTPFVWEACVKGVGVDCGRFIGACYRDAGIIDLDLKSIPRISPQWFLHKSDESFINQIRVFGTEYELKPGQKPKMADVVVVELGRDWGHSALVIDWPHVIGAANEHVVTEWKNIHLSPQYMNRKMRFFTAWPEGSDV